MCTKCLQWRMSCEFFKKDASIICLGLGSSFPICWNLVIYITSFTISLLQSNNCTNCFACYYCYYLNIFFNDHRKSIEIEAYNFAVVRDVYVHAYKEGKKWKVNTTSYSEYSNGHIQRTAKARVYMFQAGKNKVLAEASIVEQEQDSTVKNGFIASTQLSIDEVIETFN